MSGLILPNRFTSQPQYPVDIDWSNPLAQSCAGSYLPINPNTSSGSPGRTVSKYGIGNTFVRASSQSVTIPLRKNIVCTATGATVIGIANSTDLANVQGIFSISDGTSYFAVLFRGDLGGVPISAASWDGSSFNQWATSAYTSGTNYVIAITTDPLGNFNVYLNGVLQSGNQTNTGSLPTAALNKLIIGSADNGTTTYLSGASFFATAFGRVLSVAEIKALSDNPWQIFKAPQRRIWVATTSSGSTGTVAYTNANDTSAASGTTTVTGSVAKSNANDTSAASGTTTVTGTLARTNANDTVAASGTTTIVGTVSKTNANDTSTANGTTTVIGTVSYTNANDTVAASGVAGTISGTVAYTNANDTVNASGTAPSLTPEGVAGVERVIKKQKKGKRSGQSLKQWAKEDVYGSVIAAYREKSGLTPPEDIVDQITETVLAEKDIKVINSSNQEIENDLAWIEIQEKIKKIVDAIDTSFQEDEDLLLLAMME